MKTTYKQVVKAFQELALRHYQVKGFINNHPLEINDSNLKFPVVALYPGISTTPTGLIILNFNFFIMDLLMNDYSNEQDVISDTLQIGNDFVNKLRSDEETYGFEIDVESITMEPFAENFESSENADISDDVGGWYFSMNIHIMNQMSTCNLPFAPEA